MNQTFQSIRVGIFFVLGLSLIYIVYSVIGSGTFGDNEGYPIQAEFNNLRTLTAGADVRMAGVQIGEVKETRLADGRGLVVMSIDSSVSIPSDSVATITMASLLGQNYVSISYGSGQKQLGGGDRIQSEESPDFNEILGEVKKLGERLNSIADSFPDMEGSGMADMFQNLNSLVTENRGRFDSLMTNFEELSIKLNEGDGTFAKLVNEGDLYEELMAVVKDFRSSSEDMQSALSGARDLISRVEQGEGTLGRLLVGEGIADDIETSVANLKAFSEKLNSGEGTLGKLVTDDSLYYELQNMLNKADKALDSVGDSGPITAVGAVSSALF